MTAPIPSDEEVAAIERSVAEAPFDSYVLRQLAVTYLQRDRPADAVSLFVRALAEDANPSDHINLIYARGQAALQILDRKARERSAS
jgi:hypothetical protein